MGEVKNVLPKHWTGADTDIGNITIPAIGDTYVATNTGAVYFWNGFIWKAIGGYTYVERLCTAADFIETGSKAVFNTDGTWHINGLDLSGIIPDGTKAVILRVVVVDDAANSSIQFRRDATNVLNACNAVTQVATIQIDSSSVIIAIDTDKKLDYFGTDVAFTGIYVAVIGWFI